MIETEGERILFRMYLKLKNVFKNNNNRIKGSKINKMKEEKKQKKNVSTNKTNRSDG